MKAFKKSPMIFFIALSRLIVLFSIILFSACSEEMPSHSKNVHNISPKNEDAVSSNSQSKVISAHNNKVSVGIKPTEPFGDCFAYTANKTYQKTLADNLIVDAVINLPDTDKAPVLHVKSVEFDSEKLCDTFLGPVNVDEKKEGAGATYISHNKNLFISNDRTYFDYYTPLKDYIEGIINTSDTGNLNIFKLKELDFMPRNKAIAQAVSILKSINITPYGQPQVYAIDYKTLQQEQERCIREEDIKYFADIGKIKLKDNWTKDDEFYYMLFKIDVNGIPCDTNMHRHKVSGAFVHGSEIKIIVSKDGIERCMVNGAIYREEGRKNKEDTLISFEQALEVLKEKYNKIILSDKHVVSYISLIYTPVLIDYSSIDKETGELISKQIDLVPVWFFKTQQDFNDSRSGGIIAKTNYLRINAITGKEID